MAVLLFSYPWYFHYNHITKSQAAGLIDMSDRGILELAFTGWRRSSTQ